MLNISGIREGVVLDHIQAGKSMDIYRYLRLGELDCTVAIIKNAKSNKMGRKDIIKIEGPLDAIDLDVLGYIDHNITVNIIRDDKIAEKRSLHLPKILKNGWKNRREKRCQDAEKNHKCHPLQEPALHHLDRAGASAYLLSR